MLLRGLESKCENITSESRGDVTCDSLGDVTRSHGTHDVERSVGKVRRIWMRKQHQESQNRIVMSTRGFLLLWFRINRNRSSDRSSSTQASLNVCPCVRERGGPLVSACSDVDYPYCRGAPASTSTGRFPIAHVECRESEEGNQVLNQGGQ